MNSGEEYYLYLLYIETLCNYRLIDRYSQEYNRIYRYAAHMWMSEL